MFRISWSLLLLVTLAFVDGRKTEAFSSQLESRQAWKHHSTRLASGNGELKQGGGDESSNHKFLRKCRGFQVKDPPASSWAEAFHTFAGVAVNLLVLTHMNTHLVKTHGPASSIVLGPFGAFCTLCYALPGAPASQPKSSILGQAFSLTLAILLKKIPLPWTTEARISLTTALAIGVMSKLGCSHPPAGAATLLFASNEALGWSQMWILLLANVVTIILSTILNNLSSARQYPTSWGLTAKK